MSSNLAKKVITMAIICKIYFFQENHPRATAKVGIGDESHWEPPNSRRGWMRLKTLDEGMHKKPTHVRTLVAALVEGELVHGPVLSNASSTTTKKY